MLTKEKNQKLSKLLSFILRHNPGQFGIVLNDRGFCDMVELMQAVKLDRKYTWATKEDVLEVVATCEKQRYEIEGEMIRARYGHSAQTVTYAEGVPPKILYHGTNQKVVQTILKVGISKMNRAYVHLSETPKFATLAGERRGELALIQVDTELAKKLGVLFYYAGDEVWLSTNIPKECLSV